jgi:energy-coupling factor transport system ATP-binding protein
MAASTFASEPGGTPEPSLALSGYGWTPPGASSPVLEDVTLQVAPGECVLLAGATGSGKSTLLRAIAGALPPGGTARGSLHVAGRAALLFQDVDTQLLFSTVAEEVASGIRGAVGAAQRAARVEAALAGVGLAGFAERPVVDLSAGERQRVVLAALLASEPSVLLLDEPTSALDPPGRARLVAALAGLKALGHSLLIAEHLMAPFRELADRCFVVQGGRVLPGSVTRAVAAPAPPAPAADPGTPVLLRWDGVEVCDADGRTRLSATDLCVHRGERLVVSGPNGSGKTTLLHVLAGLTAPSRGRVDRDDALLASGGEPRRVAPGRVALVLQNPPRNLFARSVAEELAFTLSRTGWPAAAVEPRVRELLDACGLAGVRERSPLRLSFGEQHCVAIAAALASRPALLLLDEPFAGLDAGMRGRLLARVGREQARTGMAVVIATHDATGLEAWSRRRLVLGATRAERPSRDSRDGAAVYVPFRPDRADAAPPPAGRPVSAPGRAWHYRDTGSPLHRLGVGWKLLGVILGGVAAVAAHTPLALAALLAAWLAGYALARLRVSELWQDTRWLLVQAAVIVALSMLRDGSEGAATGLRAACQIALFFLPGALLLRTTPTGRMLESVERLLPPRLAFALATSLRFVPFFARELHEIISVQHLRGALLARRDLWRLQAWRDAVECAGVPLAVRLIHTAGEVARAAETRGIAEGPPEVSEASEESKASEKGEERSS